MRFTIHQAVALALSTVASAGNVVMYTCSDTKIVTGETGGAVSALSIRVHYSNDSDGCKEDFAFDAETGVTDPLLGFKKFCGDDGFCANVDIFGDAGLHIILDGHDVALGKADSTNYYDQDTSATICDNMGINKGYLAVNAWDHAPKTVCK